MDIICKGCGALIRAESVDLKAMAAKCQSCNAAFSIADQVALADGSAPKARSEVPRPEPFTVEYLGGTLCIKWRWYKPTAIILAAFTLTWEGVVFVFIIPSVGSGGDDFSVKLSILFTVIGIVLAYFTLTTFVNKTRIDVNTNALTVRYGPIPSVRGLSLPRDSLRQFYCVKQLYGSRNRSSARTYYHLQALNADGLAITVIRNLQDAEEALYLEQELERFLGIKDELVRGELQR
jgi:hypothetical protein